MTGVLSALTAVAFTAVAMSAAAWDLPGAPLTDAATRLGYDLRDGADSLAPVEGSRKTVMHRMKSWPEGCSGHYDLQIEQRIIAVWCKVDGQTHGSYTTSLHAPAMTVAERWLLTRTKDQPVIATFERQGGRAVLIKVE